MFLRAFELMVLISASSTPNSEVSGHESFKLVDVV